MSDSRHLPARGSSANRLRLLYRVPWIVWILSLATFEGLWLQFRRNSTPLDRARWTQRQSRRLLRMFGVALSAEGLAPAHGLIVSNHVSYLDICVIAASTPAVFVSKSEVRGYPWLGWLTQIGGTIYLVRGRSARAQSAGAEVEAGLKRGVPMAFYPEGTTTAGDTLLRFHAALFAPAARLQQMVTPAAIRYSMERGSVADEVAFWGEMEMLPHLVRLLSLRSIRATLRFGAPLPPEEGPPEQAARRLANQAQREVAGMLGVTPEAHAARKPAARPAAE